MEMLELTMADNSVAVIIVTSAPAYVISGAEIDEETPEYVLPRKVVARSCDINTR